MTRTIDRRSRRSARVRLHILTAALILLAAGCGLAEQQRDTEGEGETGGGAIKLAILSDCEGAFGSFYEQTIGGALAAFAAYAGGQAEDRSKPSAGMSGIEVAGRPIEIVGFGCSDDTADTAIRETRRLMEELGADILIGPLSGDEAIAVSNYAKSHPDKTFVNGSAGSLDPTMKVRAPNFFRYQGDGAQWNAGLGQVAMERLGWKTAAVISDDYSFAWTSTAGFIADFCAVGGQVTSRVFPPLNETDYSSHVRQLPSPDQVDGYFWAVGGAGLIPALKAFEQAHGPINPEQHIGNLFWGTPGQFEQLSRRVAGAYIGSAGSAADLKTPRAEEYTQQIADAFDAFPPVEGDTAAQASSTFVYNYFNAAWGLIEGLEAVEGDLGEGQRALQEALAEVELDAGYGRITLDSNRNGVQDQFIQQLYLDGDQLAVRTVAMVPEVDQSFGGTFTPDGPVPSRDFPPCERRDLPWTGKLIPVEDGVPQG
jgi:branched-chain amino acid transport system substrate-binding protein